MYSHLPTELSYHWKALLDELVQNSTTAVYYKVNIVSGRYSDYLSEFNGIEEVLIQAVKVPYGSRLPNQFHNTLVYSKKLKTKWSSKQNNFPAGHLFFKTKQEAEAAFLQLQKQSIVALEKHIENYKNILTTVSSYKI